jgi:PKD domain-containing protein
VLCGSLAGLLALLAAGLLASAARAQPSPAPPTVIDGPSVAITSLNGLSVARDGTGAVVYVKATHVFVSALVSGQFQTPVEVDANLPAGSSQPVIAAGNGGVLLIGFINAAQLYVVSRTSTTGPYSAPAPLAAPAANPSLQMSNLGKAYLAFTVGDGAGHDVRTAYWAGGGWSLEAAPLNAVAAGDDAGTGTGAPAVATAGDGVAIVAWGEAGHLYARRVWGTAPSVVDEQADVTSVAGCGEVSVGSPSVASGGDSSYADVAFREVVSCPGVQQARVLVNRLRGSAFDGAVAADGLPAGGESAGDPQVAMTEYGQGFVTSEGQSSNGVFGMELGNNGSPGGVLQIDSAAGITPPDPVPGIAGLFSDLVAWQQDPGTSGPAEIRVRYEPRASTLGPEMIVSNPAGGATDAARGLAVGGDVGGDGAIAWVQGNGISTQIVAEQLYQPPGGATPTTSPAYVRTPQPVLSWEPSGARWGPITYTLNVDGAAVGQTGGDALALTSPLPDGPHTWNVTATNPAGLSSGSKSARVFVDTVAPQVGATLSGARRPATRLTLHLTYRDAPPAGLPAHDASGVASLTIHWGDGTSTRVKPGTHRIVHSYRRPGRYTITITVLDRAGNRTSAVRRVKITKPRSRKGHK